MADPSFLSPDGTFFPQQTTDAVARAAADTAEASTRASAVTTEATARALQDLAPTVTTVTPATGATVTMSAGVRNLFVNPAGTIATLTVKLPPTPVANQVCEMSFGQIVTALTVQDSAAGAVETTAGAVGVAIQYRFLGSAWVKWR